MHHAQKDGSRHIAGQAANLARFQVDDHRIAEALGHERHPLIVGGDIGTFSEVSEHFDVRGQVLQRIGGRSLTHRQNQSQDRDKDSHSGILPKEIVELLDWRRKCVIFTAEQSRKFARPD
jgi:hypothetical protein